MSMAAFQRAYADLAASPKLCLAVRADPIAALASYELNAREHGRLESAVWQRGMDANCTLYRVTRITALNAVVPQTLDLVRPVLRAMLDAYWEDHPVHDVRFARETNVVDRVIFPMPPTLPEPADDIIAVARRELAAEEARLAATEN